MTPFEKLRSAAKQAKMLIAEVRHEWTYIAPGSTFYLITPESSSDSAAYYKSYVYEGTYIGVTEEAARVLLELFKEIEGLICTCGECTIDVNCYLSLDERGIVDRLRGCFEK